MALFFFILFALLFCAIIALYVYSIRVKRRVKNSAHKFSLELKAILDRQKDKNSRIAFLEQTEQRILHEKKYKNNPNARNMLLSKVFQHKAAVYFQFGDITKAIKACTQVLEVEPGHIQTLLNRASLYGETGSYQKALEDFNNAEILDSTQNPNIYNNRGWLFLQMKEYQKALDDFNTGINIQESAIQYFNRAKANDALGKKEEALDDYHKALELNQNQDPQLQSHIEKALQIWHRPQGNTNTI